MTDTTTREELVERGLLPHPDAADNQVAMAPVSSDDDEVLAGHYERTMRSLATELRWQRRRTREADDIARDAHRSAGHRGRLLEWLVDTYELDDDVVAAVNYALGAEYIDRSTS